MPTLFDIENKMSPTEWVTDYKCILEKMHLINPLQYAKTRNFINGAVTYLSPYISRGVISVQQVKEIVLNKGYKTYEIEKFLQELAWREYYQRVWQSKGHLIEQDLKQAQTDVSHFEMVAALQNAATDIEAIDQSIQQLYTTGYMHNHCRMYVAALTCNIAKAYWLQPSRWMYYHLLDGDIASNNCSWQWVAGAFASKKYYCNQENINKYTHSNQRNTFLDQSYEAISMMAVPDVLQGTSVLELTTQLPLTTVPFIDTDLPTLIYNGYNLDPLWRKDLPANRVLLLEPSHFSKYPVSEKVIEFILKLALNIEGVQIYCGEIADILDIYKGTLFNETNAIISKEHPAFNHYPGIIDSRTWMYPEVTDYYPVHSCYENIGNGTYIGIDAE
ncbi:MAG: FAD-binding domain-containing protein [Ferruginibacter sp.]